MDAAARPVKNQEQCSPIWALSNKSSPEDDWFIVAGNMLLLSEPQPVNCDTVDSDYKGELMNNGFAFAEKSTMRTETFHSYTAKNCTCMASSSTDEQTFKVAVAQQRVPISPEADQSPFQSHEGADLCW